MTERRNFLDDVDNNILRELQQNCRIPNGKIAENLGMALSTVHYRIKRLEDEGIIQGYHAKIDLSRFQEEFNVCLLIGTKSDAEQIDQIKALLQTLKEVWAVYYVLGSKNFVVMARTKNQRDFMDNIYQRLMGSHLIATIDTLVVTDVIREELPGLT